MFAWWHALRRHLPSTPLGVLLTLLVIALFIVDTQYESQKPWFVEPLHRLELLASDLRFQVRGPRLPDSDVVVVAIDEKSIDQLGRWPWPYTVQADLVKTLTAYGATAIGYDVVFSSSDLSAGKANLDALHASLARRGYLQDQELHKELQSALEQADHDQRFANALADSKRTILGYFFHWQCDDVAHLKEEGIQREFAHLTASTNARYTPRLAAGASLHGLQLASACAVEANIPLLSNAVWGNGFFNSRPDADDGIIRYYPLVAHYRGPNAATAPEQTPNLFAPLGIRLLERYFSARHGQASTLIAVDTDQSMQVWLVTGHDRVSIPADAQGRLLINHLGPTELAKDERLQTTRRWRFPRYSVADIVKGNRVAAPPQAFKDKIVLVGATAVGLADLRITPFDAAFPGVETHATILDNIVRQQFLVQPWWGPLVTMAQIGLVGLILFMTLPHLGVLWGDIATTGLLAGNIGVNYWLFAAFGFQLNLVYPVLTVVLVWTGITIYHFVFEQRQSRYLRNTFSTYMSPALVNILVTQRITPALGGSSGDRTAYFTDIASFSSFSEVLTATQLVELLNEYLSAMTNLLVEAGGTLDKYEGDAIVAFFGAPIAQPDHALRAVRVALGMQLTLDGLRAKWQGEGDKWPALVHDMRMRIGMASGDIVIGNMGSTMRMDYTMMGDVVNTAARLEAAAKQYGVYILCTTKTLEEAGAELFEWRTIDRIRVVGKEDAIDTVEIMTYAGGLSAEYIQMRALYHQGVALYRQQKWDEAITKFTESEKLEEVFPRRPTNPSRVYLERCQQFKIEAPPYGWDGSWTLTSK